MLEPKLIEILEQYFAIDNFQDPLALITFRNRFLDFLREENNLLAPADNPNIVITKDVIRLIDANNNYTTSSNRSVSSEYLRPFFERLLKDENWGYYDLKILSEAIMYAPTAEFAVELGAKSIMPIVNIRLAGSSDVIQGILASSICSRLLYAKYFDDELKIDLTDKFMTWFKKLERLAEKNKELTLPYLYNQIRHALFYQNQEEIFRLCEKVKKDDIEQSANAITSTVGFYTSSLKYNSMLHEGVSN